MGSKEQKDKKRYGKLKKEKKPRGHRVRWTPQLGGVHRLAAERCAGSHLCVWVGVGVGGGRRRSKTLNRSLESKEVIG